MKEQLGDELGCTGVMGKVIGIEPGKVTCAEFHRTIRFLLNFVCLFMAALSLHCSARAFSSAWATFLQWLPLLQSSGSREQVSEVVVHRLRCPKACGIFLAQGLNPCLLHWQADA